MKNILVPTDFSNNAFKALAYAAVLAKHCGARVHIVHAWVLLENTLVSPGSMRQAWNDARTEEKATALLQVQQDISERFPDQQFENHLFTGPTEEVLLKYCETAAIDLVIMGKHGAEGLERVFMGSVTASLISKSNVPVLAIPEHYDLNQPDSLVLATSEFDRNPRLTAAVFELASVFGLSVHVLVFAKENQVEANIMRQAAQLADYVAWLKQHYPLARISGSLSEGDDLEQAISDYCEKNGIGIICMLTYHRGFWESIFNPSITRKMAFHTKIPLLAIPVKS
jgi:nucleotide-binding universal stress UspA family protein